MWLKHGCASSSQLQQDSEVAVLSMQLPVISCHFIGLEGGAFKAEPFGKSPASSPHHLCFAWLTQSNEAQ